MFTENQIRYVDRALDHYINELERQAAASIIRPLNLRGKIDKFPVQYQVVIDEAKATKEAFRALVKKAEAVTAAVEEFDVTKQNNPHNQYEVPEESRTGLKPDVAPIQFNVSERFLETKTDDDPVGAVTPTSVAQSTDKLIGVDKALAEKLYPKIDEVIDNSAELRAERAAAAKEEIVDALDETVKAALDIVPEEVPVVVKKKVAKDVKE